jgi:hypothetical protein
VQSQPKVGSPPEQKRIYRAIVRNINIRVFKHVDFDITDVTAGPFDIEIGRGVRGKPIVNESRVMVLERNIETTKNIPMALFTKFMKGKFGYHQVKHDKVFLTLSDNMMSYVAAPLDWIESVIDVEIDYHLGVRECLLPENAKLLEYYKECPWSGYGKEFGPEGPSIQGSRHYAVFINPEKFKTSQLQAVKC